MKTPTYKLVLQGWMPTTLLTLRSHASVDALALLLRVVRLCFLAWRATDGDPAKRKGLKARLKADLILVKARLRHLEDCTDWRQPSYAGTLLICSSELITILELGAESHDASAFMDGVYLRRGDAKLPRKDA
jgi:hypothetical protein